MQCIYSEVKQDYLLSFSEHPFKRVIINRCEDNSFYVNVVDWEFVNEDIVYIKVILDMLYMMKGESI